MAPLLAEVNEGSTCKDAENAGSASDIKDDFVFEEMRVIHDGIHVGLGADGVFEHFLMDGEMRVAVKIVVGIFDVADIGLLVVGEMVLDCFSGFFWFHG